MNPPAGGLSSRRVEVVEFQGEASRSAGGDGAQQCLLFARPIQLFRSRPLIPLRSLMAARVWLPSSSAKIIRFF